MVTRTQLALNDAAEWLGDWHPLADQLGSAHGLLALGAISRSLGVSPVVDLASLRGFLCGYHEQILLPHEMPAIRKAREHASKHELRELVALDRQLEKEPALAMFAHASWRTGQGQLQKLRPLRDDRVVQRYLQAVETGQAHGWHTLVYGLTLAVYSLPSRQGLLGYAHQVTRGFIYSAASRMHFSERECRDLFEDICDPLPGVLEVMLADECPQVPAETTPT
jgi:urease accessory protein UreF